MSFIYRVFSLCEIFDLAIYLPFSPGIRYACLCPPPGNAVCISSSFSFLFLRNIPPFVSTNTFISFLILSVFFYGIVTNLNETN